MQVSFDMVVCMCAYTYVYVCIFMFVCVCICMYVMWYAGETAAVRHAGECGACSHTHAYMHVCLHHMITYMYIHMIKYMYIHMIIYIYIYIHTYIYIYTYIHLQYTPHVFSRGMNNSKKQHLTGSTNSSIFAQFKEF